MSLEYKESILQVVEMLSQHLVSSSLHFGFLYDQYESFALELNSHIQMLSAYI